MSQKEFDRAVTGEKMEQCKCCLCGEEWDSGQDSKFYLGKAQRPKRQREELICYPCRIKKQMESKFWFREYCPEFVVGADLCFVEFENLEQLIDYLKNNAREGYVCCWDGNNIIADVSTTEKSWWVRGFVPQNCLENSDIPFWKDEVKRRYGSI